VGNLRSCTVAFTDSTGVRHTAEVTAESLYEAAALGIKAISEQWASEPGLMTSISVEVRAPAVSHEVTLRQLRQWVDGTCTGPREALLKQRLKAVLPG
jgi:hypothetical protein